MNGCKTNLKFIWVSIILLNTRKQSLKNPRFSQEIVLPFHLHAGCSFATQLVQAQSAFFPNKLALKICYKESKNIMKNPIIELMIGAGSLSRVKANFNTLLCTDYETEMPK